MLKHGTISRQKYTPHPASKLLSTQFMYSFKETKFQKYYTVFMTRIYNELGHWEIVFILSKLNFYDKNSSGTVEMQSRH